MLIMTVRKRHRLAVKFHCYLIVCNSTSIWATYAYSETFLCILEMDANLVPVPCLFARRRCYRLSKFTLSFKRMCGLLSNRWTSNDLRFQIIVEGQSQSIHGQFEQTIRNDERYENNASGIWSWPHVIYG